MRSRFPRFFGRDAEALKSWRDRVTHSVTKYLHGEFWCERCALQASPTTPHQGARSCSFIRIALDEASFEILVKKLTSS